MFETVDVDGSGMIDYSEFVMATMNEKELISTEKLKAAFNLFDLDGTGTISPDEIKSVLCIDDNAIIDKIIADIDENDDGVI